MSYVINPETGRQIKVGGAAYRKLMRKQLMEQQREAMAQGYTAAYEENQDPYEELGYVENKPVPRGNIRVGKKIGKKKSKKIPTHEEISAFTAKSATRAFQENMGDIVSKATQCETEDDMMKLEKHLQTMILKEMMKSQDPPKKRLEKMKRSMQQSRNVNVPEQEEYYVEDTDYEQ